MDNAERVWGEYHQLWRRAFGDTKKYTDYYFERKAPRSALFEDREDEKLCSMAFFTMYDAILRGKRCCLPYIVGVATDKSRRHEGRMTRVLLSGMEEMKKQGCPLVFLSPADPAIYTPLGFVPGFMRQTTIWEREGYASLQIRTWDSLDAKQRQQTSAFVERQLQKEPLDLHLVHHELYYDEVNRELQAIDGNLLVLFSHAGIEGTANRIVEEGCQEITELICRRETADRVMESLRVFCGGDKLTVDDSTFIAHLQGDGIRHKKQDKPYLMYRLLDAHIEEPLRCYVNDIT